MGRKEVAKTYKAASTIIRLPKPVKPRSKNHGRNLLVKEVIREAFGLSPYEKHILEFLRLNKDRQALRYAKKRIGQFKLAKKKVDEIANFK